jgi:hypothetical protein
VRFPPPTHLVADSGAADGMPEVMFLQCPGELLGSVVAAAVVHRRSERQARMVMAALEHRGRGG